MVKYLKSGDTFSRKYKHRITRMQLNLDIALLIAKRSTCVRNSVGCVIVDSGGHILSTGYNGVARSEPHCIEGKLCSKVVHKSGESLDSCLAIHAEINAIIRCPDIEKIDTLYCTHKPCTFCKRVIANTSCKEVIYINDYPVQPKEENQKTEKVTRIW